MKDLFSNFSSDDLMNMKRRMKEAAAEAGLPFGDRDRTFNSRLAQELGKWAERNNKGDAFQHAIFKAYFSEGINIAKIPALINLAASIGLPREEAEVVLLQRTFKTDVDEDWLLSQKNGITAVPTFVMNKEKLIGAQPYEMLVNFMETQGVQKRIIS